MIYDDDVANSCHCLFITLVICRNLNFTADCNYSLSCTMVTQCTEAGFLTSDLSGRAKIWRYTGIAFARSICHSSFPNIFCFLSSLTLKCSTFPLSVLVIMKQLSTEINNNNNPLIFHHLV